MESLGKGGLAAATEAAKEYETKYPAAAAAGDIGVVATINKGEKTEPLLVLNSDEAQDLLKAAAESQIPAKVRFSPFIVR